jgi:large subunit ribosomal protein L22
MPDFLAGPGVRKIIRRETDKAPFGRVTIQTSGEMAVVNVHTVKPDRLLQRRSPDLVPELERVLNRTVTIQPVPEAHAVHKYVRVPPNKARRVMNEIRGKHVDEALAILQFVPNRAAGYIRKLVKSAAANAFEGWGAEPGELKITVLTADPGPTMKRVQPRAMGRAYRILKRSSHLSVAVTAAEARPARGSAARRRGASAVTRATRGGARPAAGKPQEHTHTHDGEDHGHTHD